MPKTGVDRYNEPVRGDAVELDVRWNQKRSQVTGPNGTPVALDATAVLDREVEIGSQMWLGTLSEWNGTGSAEDLESDVHEVVTCNVTKDIKGRFTRYTVGLTKFGNAPDSET